MATAQPMPMSPDDQDPTGGGDDTQTGAQGDGAYVIEIRVSANKEITVCVESGSEEDAEEQGGDAGGDPDGGDYGASGDDNSVPVKSIKEGLTLALEIFKNDGQMPQQADDQFQQGFQGASA